VEPDFFRTRKVLALLPLAALTAGVFWYVHGRKTEEYAVKELPAENAPVFPAVEAAAPAQNAAEAVSALQIQGSPEFKGRVTGALKLIWLADRDTFLFIKKYIYIVRSEDKTGFYLDGGQPVASVSDANVSRSLPWCAGIIAHQAFHSYLKFSSVKKKNFTPPPPGTEKPLRVEANPMALEFTGLAAMLDAERKASEFQAKVLSMTGASRSEIREVEKRGPRDFSAGHDGSYAATP